jgi:hypothetical protein
MLGVQSAKEEVQRSNYKDHPQDGTLAPAGQAAQASRYRLKLSKSRRNLLLCGPLKQVAGLRLQVP